MHLTQPCSRHCLILSTEMHQHVNSRHDAVMINYTCIMRLKSACGTRKLVNYNLRSTRGWRHCALPDVLALVRVRTPDEPANSHSRFSCHVSFVHCSATSLLSVTMKLSNAMSADIDHSSRPIAACCQTTPWYKFLLKKNKANFVFQESTRWIQIAWFNKINVG